jgi:hypothetical protein
MTKTQHFVVKSSVSICAALCAGLAAGPARAQVDVGVSVSVSTPTVEVHAVADFYEPLSPYGRWEVVGSYGRCWIPSGVAVGWVPYSYGYWQWTDAGWFWVSEEPWGWATYHYGCWDFDARIGWFWVPRTHWAPAWVVWREGGGYVGWAPLHPAGYARVASVSFVFVEERRFMEPVRPTTVIVKNTTIINKTKNITNTRVVNESTIYEGPKVAAIERAHGKKIESVPMQELRTKQESKVAAKQKSPGAKGEGKGSTAGTKTEPDESKSGAVRGAPGQAEKAAPSTKEPQQPDAKQETSGRDERKPDVQPSQPEKEKAAPPVEGKKDAPSEPAKKESTPEQKKNNGGEQKPSSSKQKKTAPDQPGPQREKKNEGKPNAGAR